MFISDTPLSMLKSENDSNSETDHDDEISVDQESLEIISPAMANDSRFVLAQLVRTGIWSRLGNIFAHKHLVLDAESAVTYLYKQCQANHVRRQKALLSRRSKGGSRQAPAQIDYYAATIVNYQEFGQYVEQLLDFFESHSFQLHIVYRGKYMEAPLFGLLPAQIKKNTQRASEPLNMLLEYNSFTSTTPTLSSSKNSSSAKSSSASNSPSSSPSSSSGSSGGRARKRYSLELYMSQLRPSRANLALNVFKQLVNAHRGRAKSKKHPIKTYQAYYSAFPTLAQLARDHKCPVLTNDGDFIIMDVRAGFLLFEDFFKTYLASQNAMLRYNSASSVSSTASTASNASRSPKTPTATRTQSSMTRRRSRSTPPVSPKSPAAGLSDAKSLFSQPSQASRIRFHLNSLFLRQHPGLNQALSLQLFPLTTGEFVVKHAKSMIKMRIYDREFKEEDLISVSRDLDARTSVKKYHMAAARLEMVSRYLCTKDPELLNSLLKGEAHRLLASGSTFDEDYKELFNYYAVAHDFRGRLKFVLKYLTDASQIDYLAGCLLERECTADYLLSLLCCSIGRMSSISYNKSMQFEDLQTRHSAFAMLDRGRQLLMSLLCDNKSHKSEHSASLSDKERSKISARFKLAALTVVDRQHHQLIERTLATSSASDPKTSTPQLDLTMLAKRSSSSRDLGPHKEAIAFMELAFRQPPGAFTKLTTPQKLGQLITSPGAQGDQLKQLAILLNLHRYSLSQAAQDDAHFKLNYLGLNQAFEMALVDQFIYTNRLGAGKQLVDLVTKFDLENVAQASVRPNHSIGQTVINKSSSAAKQQQHSKTKSNPKSDSSRQPGTDHRDPNATRRHLRHLIELLNSSLEAYCELNAFLNYPLARLDLAHCYNPILLFNLASHNLLDKE